MEKTEKALVILLDTGNKVIAALADDGKVDFGEGVGIAMKGVGLINVFKNLQEITREIKTATPEDIVLLVEIFKEKFDLANDVAELKVEQGIEVLVQLALMVFTPKAA